MDTPGRSLGDVMFSSLRREWKSHTGSVFSPPMIASKHEVNEIPLESFLLLIATMASTRRRLFFFQVVQIAKWQKGWRDRYGVYRLVLSSRFPIKVPLESIEITLWPSGTETAVPKCITPRLKNGTFPGLCEGNTALLFRGRRFNPAIGHVSFFFLFPLFLPEPTYLLKTSFPADL
ncbi:hypothetical protein VTK56DRAFT_6754 [Thermocarpiscus australiensis]